MVRRLDLQCKVRHWVQVAMWLLSGFPCLLSLSQNGWCLLMTYCHDSPFFFPLVHLTLTSKQWFIHLWVALCPWLREDVDVVQSTFCLCRKAGLSVEAQSLQYTWPPTSWWHQGCWYLSIAPRDDRTHAIYLQCSLCTWESTRTWANPP